MILLLRFLGSDVAWRFLAFCFHPHINVGEEREFCALCFHMFLSLFLFSPQLGLCNEKGLAFYRWPHNACLLNHVNLSSV